MPELITRANQAILRAQWLRNEGHSLRSKAAVLARELGKTMSRTHAAADERSSIRSGRRSRLDQGAWLGMNYNRTNAAGFEAELEDLPAD